MMLIKTAFLFILQQIKPATENLVLLTSGRPLVWTIWRELQAGQGQGSIRDMMKSAAKVWS